MPPGLCAALRVPFVLRRKEPRSAGPRPDGTGPFPRAQHRPLAKALGDFVRRYPDRHEAMARAFHTGVYAMQEIDHYFRVHYLTVSWAECPLQAGGGSEADLPERPQNA